MPGLLLMETASWWGAWRRRSWWVFGVDARADECTRTGWCRRPLGPPAPPGGSVLDDRLDGRRGLAPGAAGRDVGDDVAEDLLGQRVQRHDRQRDEHEAGD